MVEFVSHKRLIGTWNFQSVCVNFINCTGRRPSKDPSPVQIMDPIGF